MSESAKEVETLLRSVTVNRSRASTHLTETEVTRFLAQLEPILLDLEARASATAEATAKLMWNGFSKEGGPVIRADSKSDVITQWVLQKGYGEISGNIKSLTYRDPATNKAIYYIAVVPTSEGIQELIIIHDSKKNAVDFSIPTDEDGDGDEETNDE